MFVLLGGFSSCVSCLKHFVSPMLGQAGSANTTRGSHKWPRAAEAAERGRGSCGETRSLGDVTDGCSPNPKAQLEENSFFSQLEFC